MALLDDVLPGPRSPGPDRIEIPEPDPERLVILQYTSGSTSEPKGVMLPDRVLGSNLDAIFEAGQIDPAHDVAISWLPLYHDMGLVGLLTLPMTCGADLVQAAPQDFLAHPGSWMQWISDFRGTATAGPNFSWVLATRALKRMHGLDLSSMRIALNGAEPVDPDGGRGLRRRGLPPRLPARGGVPGLRHGRAGHRRLVPATHAGPGVRHRRRRDARAPAPGQAGAMPSCPVPVAWPCWASPCRVWRCASSTPSTGEILPERHVGELEISGTSVTPGYYRSPDATAELFRDGWLRTGDLAYLVDGELVICGRIKDVIIVGGRNIYPQDIERAIGTIDGIRAGNVIAFGVEGYKGKESVVVVAEVKGGEPDADPQGHPPPGAGSRRRAPARHHAGEGRHPAQDQLGQAPALALQGALPRGGAPARLRVAPARVAGRRCPPAGAGGAFRRRLFDAAILGATRQATSERAPPADGPYAALRASITPCQRSGSLL